MMDEMDDERDDMNTSRMGEIEAIIRSNLTRTFIGTRDLAFTDKIPQKKMKPMMERFYDGLIIPNMIAFYDDSLIRRGRDGVIFTLYGVFYASMLEKSFYFNYLDIEDIGIIPAENGKETDVRLNIKFRNGSDFTIGYCSYLSKEGLKETLFSIQALVSAWDDFASIQPTGFIQKRSFQLDPDEKATCQKIIHGVSVGASGAGLVSGNIPFATTALITPAQIAMIIALGQVFGIKIDTAMAKSLVLGYLASFGGRLAATELVGIMPGIGNLLKAGVAGGVTEAIGWGVVKNFYYAREDSRAAGIKAGYIQASNVYEAKFRTQAKTFIAQYEESKDSIAFLQNNRVELNQLLDDYKKTIFELTTKPDSTETEKSELKQMVEEFNELKGTDT